MSLKKQYSSNLTVSILVCCLVDCPCFLTLFFRNLNTSNEEFVHIFKEAFNFWWKMCHDRVLDIML